VGVAGAAQQQGPDLRPVCSNLPVQCCGASSRWPRRCPVERRFRSSTVGLRPANQRLISLLLRRCSASVERFEGGVTRCRSLALPSSTTTVGLGVVHLEARIAAENRRGIWAKKTGRPSAAEEQTAPASSHRWGWRGERAGITSVPSLVRSRTPAGSPPVAPAPAVTGSPATRMPLRVAQKHTPRARPQRAQVKFGGAARRGSPGTRQEANQFR